MQCDRVFTGNRCAEFLLDFRRGHAGVRSCRNEELDVFLPNAARFEPPKKRREDFGRGRLASDVVHEYQHARRGGNHFLYSPRAGGQVESLFDKLTDGLRSGCGLWREVGQQVRVRHVERMNFGIGKGNLHDATVRRILRSAVRRVYHVWSHVWSQVPRRDASGSSLVTCHSPLVTNH